MLQNKNLVWPVLNFVRSRLPSDRKVRLWHRPMSLRLTEFFINSSPRPELRVGAPFWWSTFSYPLRISYFSKNAFLIRFSWVFLPLLKEFQGLLLGSSFPGFPFSLSERRESDSGSYGSLRSQVLLFITLSWQPFRKAPAVQLALLFILATENCYSRCRELFEFVLSDRVSTAIEA